MKKLLTYFGFGLMAYAFTLCSVSQVNATTFAIDQVDGDWTNAQPSAAITINNSGSSGGLSTARWGTSMGSGQSGYDFSSRTTPFNAESNGTAFSLGAFTHQNWPIGGTPLTSIDLLLNLQDIGIFNLSTTFSILHNETPNSTGGSADNDIVTITNPIVNNPFNYNGQNYYFNLFGFSQDGGTTLTTMFSTTEGQSNTANLYARITEAPVPAVPEPSTMFFLGGGLACLAFWRRKRV